MIGTLTADTLKGNWATLLMPVNSDDSFDYYRLADELDRLILARVNGIYSNGTAGEFHNQTENEFDRVSEILAEICGKNNMPFQIGAGHSSPVISLERIKRSVSLKPSAFQVILPDWLILQPDEQLIFLHKMAEAADGIPLVLYNPPHAKQVLSPADFMRLKQEVPQLIGIKTAGGDEKWYDEMRLCMAGLAVFVPGHFLASGFKTGVAKGSYSNVACINPAFAQDWWEMMQYDIGHALNIQNRILQFFDQCILPCKNAGYSNPALDKFLAAVGGWAEIGTRLRWPYQFISEAEVKPARDIARKIIPEFFTAKNTSTHDKN